MHELLIKWAFEGPYKGLKSPKIGQWCLLRNAWPVGPLCSVWTQNWCLTRHPEGQKVPFLGRMDPLDPRKPPQSPRDAPKPPRNPPKLFNDPPYNQYNPSSYFITYYCSREISKHPNCHWNLKNAQEQPNCTKTAQNAQKSKSQKVQKLKCDPCASPMMFTGPKDMKNSHKNTAIRAKTAGFGGAEWKKLKKWRKKLFLEKGS